MKKNFIKDKQKFFMSKGKVLLITTLSASLCLAPIISYADDWDGWTEEHQEEAWTVYVTTDWNEVSSLNFSISESGSIASADVPDDFRNNYGSIVEAVLSDNSLSTVYYNSTNRRDKTAYKELLLAMGYTLNKKGEFDNLLGTEDMDVCFINKYVSDSYSISEPKDSFEALFRRLIASERAYCNNHMSEAQQYSIYSNDEYLAAVIQGALYGSGYAKANSSYTSDNADSYYNDNQDKIKTKWNGFASDVLDIYSAVISVNDHTVVG